MKTLFWIALAAAALPVGSAAAEPVPVPAFRSIELTGGGAVTVRSGPRQQVNLIRGSTRITDFRVRNGTLVIRACRTSCRDYDLRIEIVTPRIDAVAITGGGRVDLAPGFRPQERLALAVTGGGAIDADALAAGDVAAAIRGGGAITAGARDTLAASVSGGGAIRYRGDPRVASNVRGGGSVVRLGR